MHSSNYHTVHHWLHVVQMNPFCCIILTRKDHAIHVEAISERVTTNSIVHNVSYICRNSYSTSYVGL